MSASRRNFLKTGAVLTASALTGCGGGGRRIAAGPWTSTQLQSLGTAAGNFLPKGWAVMQGGKIVQTWNPGAAGPSLSITKVLAALACARAAEEGWLTPSETAASTISEWRGDARKSAITISMLLQQVSGLEAGVAPLYRSHPADKGRAAVSLRCTDEPGSVFRYGPSHWETLAEILRRKLKARGRTLRGHMDGAVLRPAGLKTSKWRSDGGNVPYFSTGVEFDLHSLLKLGGLLGQLLAGKDAGGFSAARFAAFTRPSGVNPMFGGGLWRNSGAASPFASEIEIERSIDDPLPASFWRTVCMSRSQPAELVALVGSGGKRVYLWPSTGKIIARLGASTAWSDARFLGAIS